MYSSHEDDGDSPLTLYARPVSRMNLTRMMSAYGWLMCDVYVCSLCLWILLVYFYSLYLSGSRWRISNTRWPRRSLVVYVIPSPNPCAWFSCLLFLHSLHETPRFDIPFSGTLRPVPKTSSWLPRLLRPLRGAKQHIHVYIFHNTHEVLPVPLIEFEGGFDIRREVAKMIQTCTRLLRVLPFFP